jgi:hypothetical protein
MKIRLVAINERGRRIGEGHNMAKLSDHDVELIWSLLDERERITKSLTEYGLAQREIDNALSGAQLSFSGIGEKFEVTKWCIWRISMGLRRGQYPAKWKRLKEAATA